MTIHDDARAAFESVYDTELARYQNLLSIADTELVQLRTDKATFVAEVERLLKRIEGLEAEISRINAQSNATIETLRAEIVQLKARVAELEAEQEDPVPEGWAVLYDSTFEKNDGWSLRSETQSNDNSYNTPNNVLFGKGMTVVGRRESVGGRPYTSGDALGRHIRTPNYFRAEVTATLPVEYGQWPCPLWFRPLTHGDSGEIDVCETWPFDWNGVPRMYTTVWENYTTKRKENARLDYSKLPNPDPAEPHTYAVEKVKGRITFSVDGVTVYSWEKGRMNPTMASWYDSVYEIAGREWYPRITLQIGGSNAKEPRADWKQSEMVIHRLRIFKEA